MNSQNQTRQDPFNHNIMQGAIPPPFPGTSHQSLNQALGSRLQGVNMSPSFQNNFRLPSGSPSHSPISTHIDLVNSSQNHPGPSNARSPLHQFSVPLPGVEHESASAALKRKQTEHETGGATKRRRDGDENIDDGDGGPGAKHWSEEEKTKLFHWIMGPDQDDHWNSLRAAKNSALRDCASEVFSGKKTYQALKGCYERNFNLFRQIYAFQSFSDRLGPIAARTDGDRIREYEKRLADARKDGCDVGSVNARTIDHWHRTGWYNLFYARWNGDPATTARVVPRGPNGGTYRSTGGEDSAEPDEEPVADFSNSSISSGNIPQRTTSGSFSSTKQSQSSKDPVYSDPVTPNSTGSVASSSDQTLVNVSLPQNMMAMCLELLQTQAKQNVQRLEFMRRREEREERDSRQRLELEKTRQERETAELELKKQTAEISQKSKLATDILSAPTVDPQVKEAASTYLKHLFAI